jgi:hypothetical protein
MRRAPRTQEELDAENAEALKIWEKIKLNSPFFTPKVPDEKPRED